MRQYDTIIIGGGIAGMSIAYGLCENQRILVLERESNLGYHSTGRSAAVYAASYKSSNSAINALTRASRAMFKNPPDGFSENSLYRERGLIYIAHKERLSDLAKFYDSIRATSDGIEWLDRDAIVEKFPLLKDAYTVSAVYDPNVFDIDVNELSEGYRRNYLKSGGELITEFHVTGIVREPGKWRVTNGNETYEARNVVNAAGAWVDEIARIAGVPEIGIQPLRRSAILISVDDCVGIERFADWPMAVEFEESFYFKPDAGKLLVSPANEDLSVPCDARPEELDIAYAADFAERALNVTVKRIDHAWAGLRSFVSDRGVVMGFDEEAEGFFWLAGQGGVGVQTAPAAGRMAAALIQGREIPRDLTDLGLNAAFVSPNRIKH